MRRLLWSWWPWALLCVYFIDQRNWWAALGVAAWSGVCSLSTPVEFPPQYGLDHGLSVGDPEFLDTMAGAAGVPFSSGNSLELLNNGDRFYPAMLEAIEQAKHIDHDRGLHLLGRRNRRDLRSRAGGGRRPRCLRQDSARRGWLGQRRQRNPADAREGRLPCRLVQPDSLESPAAHQQPHAPQVVDRRRTDRLHRRRRHCRSLDRRRPGRQALARSADPHRGARGAAAADRLRAELAGVHRRAGHGTAFLPRCHARRRPVAADDHELAGNRRVDGARDVLPGYFRGARVDRHRQSLLRAGPRVDRPLPRRREATASACA